MKTGLRPLLDLERIRRIILADRGFVQKLAWSLIAIAVPAGLRWFLDRGANGFPFVTFFPAVVLAAVLLDWRFAMLVVVGAGASSWLIFRGDALAHLPLQSLLMIVALYLLATSALILVGAILRSALAELDELHRNQHTLNLEMRHRFKNMVAVVNALALQTVKSSRPDEFFGVLSGRLQALATAVDILSNDEDACNIQELVARAVAPFQVNARIRLSGPALELRGRVSTALMLTLHELATNALKYGALSNGDGTIEIAWTLSSASGYLVDMGWIERNGPPVLPPEREGFGSRLLNTLPTSMRIERVFDPAGLRCSIAVLEA